MMGPFKTARGRLTHLLVAVDKYTKWVEAKPIKKLDGVTARNFVIDVVMRFGMPHSIITDNGTNFAIGELAKYCKQTELMTHKYRGSQQSLTEVKPKFIDSTQGEPKNICEP